MKKIAMIAIATLTAAALLGCSAQQAESERHEATSIDETAVISVTVEEVLPDSDVNTDTEWNTERAEQPQAEKCEPPNPVIPQIIQPTVSDSETDTRISASSTATVPTSNTASQAEIPQPTETMPSLEPEPQPITESEAQPEPTPTPEPVPPPAPLPLPEPTPEPQPPPSPPVVVEPPPARTICNICEADITGNVAAHGTPYLLNGENFSYRVE